MRGKKFEVFGDSNFSPLKLFFRPPPSPILVQFFPFFSRVWKLELTDWFEVNLSIGSREIILIFAVGHLPTANLKNYRGLRYKLKMSCPNDF